MRIIGVVTLRAAALGIAVSVLGVPAIAQGVRALPETDSALAAQAERLAAAPDAKAIFIEPTDAPHRHCFSACLKSGSLLWMCKPSQSCALDCNTSPPSMHCHEGRR